MTYNVVVYVVLGSGKISMLNLLKCTHTHTKQPSSVRFRLKYSNDAAKSQWNLIKICAEEKRQEDNERKQNKQHDYNKIVHTFSMVIFFSNGLSGLLSVSDCKIEREKICSISLYWKEGHTKHEIQRKQQQQQIQEIRCSRLGTLTLMLPRALK